MNGYEDAAVYTLEQLRGFFENYHATGKHGRTRVDREAPEGYAARVQTEDERLRLELEGAGFTCEVTGDKGCEFLVATLEEPLPTDYEREALPDGGVTIGGGNDAALW